jgi:hypothetical protein
MKEYDRVLRYLADRALHPAGRTWDSVDAVTAAVNAPRATVGRVMQHLESIGAADRLPGSGAFEICAPERVVDLYKARWNRSQHFLGYAPEAAVTKLVSNHKAVWGGCRAGTYHLNGIPAAGFSELTAYLSSADDTTLNDEPFANCVTVYWWGPETIPGTGYASLTQTVAELFATPGWQADEFYRSLYFTHLMPLQGDVNVNTYGTITQVS